MNILKAAAKRKVCWRLWSKSFRCYKEASRKCVYAPGHWDNLSADIIDLPECVCCVSTQKGLTVSQKYDAMYGFYHECVDKGYALGREPLFAVSERTDYLEGTLTTEPFTFHVCIPVVPEKAPAEAVVFPACRALSVLYLGSYKDVDTAWACSRQRGKGEKSETCGLSPRTWYSSPLYRPRNRPRALLLKTGASDY